MVLAKQIFLAVAFLGLVVERLPGQPASKPSAQAKSTKTAAKGRPLLDLHGDPLPIGAIARLGTTRFRNGLFKPCFLADGKTLMTASRRSIQFWETATGRLVREISTGLYVHRIALSLGGKLVAAAGTLRSDSSYQSVIRVWDVASGKEMRTFSGADRKANHETLAFRPDGKVVVSIDNGLVRFESVASGKEFLRHQFPRGSLSNFALSADGAMLAVAAGHRKLFLWNWKAREEPCQIEVPDQRIYCLRFSPDNEVLAGCEQMGFLIRLWHARTGAFMRTIDMKKEQICGADLAFSPDGKLLAVADSGNRKNMSGGLYLWNLKNGRYFRQLRTVGEQVLFADFSPDGRLVAATTSAGVRVWDVLTGRRVGDDIEAAHGGALTQIAISPRGLAATASDDHTVRIWDLASGRQKFKLDHDQPVGGAILSPDSAKLVTSTSDDDAIRFWDLTTGKETKRVPGLKKFAHGRALAFSPDGQRLLSWADNLSLRVLDGNSGKLLMEHAVPPIGGEKPKTDIEETIARQRLLMLGMGACGFTPNGKYLLLSFFGKVSVFETATGREWQTIPGGWYARSLAVSPDGRSFLASFDDRGGQDKKHMVFLWELATGKIRKSLSLPGEEAGPVAFSANGKFMAIGLPRPPGAIQLFSLAKDRTGLTFTGFSGKSTLLKFSPDGKHLVSAMDDTSALVWQITK